VTGQAAITLKEAETPEDAVAALEKKVAKAATPRIVPPGAMVLQPSDERRKSGSHYTPRSLTEPIVRTTLRPILERLGESPKPEQILDLKVCDPAMGSGAFLVEACRQLGDELVKAWHAHDCVPTIPPDEDELLHARRIVAQRCLYGVDKNPMAVDLAKLSLWLATLAKYHPFTFLDHALRCGDSLVGLTRKQIVGFHWKPERQRDFARGIIEDRINRATVFRREIREAVDGTPESLLRQKLDLADEALNPLRFCGDLVASAFFAVSNDRQRKARIDELAVQLSGYLQNPHHLNLSEPLDAARKALAVGEKPVMPVHWEIEFPEAFDRDNPGFDAFVGNPPFAGKNTLAAAHREGYPDWLKQIHDESHGNSDLVAHFFRRTYNLLRQGGAFGLIATNTIGQGDTRSTGLRWICTHGGTIYEAIKRKKWPGQAAVIVSVVHVHKGLLPAPYRLDGRREVPIITAYLFHGGGHEDPAKLRANECKSFQGSILLGMGFTFDDTDTDGVASPLAEMNRLVEKDPRNAERVFPYIGGDELNNSPNQSHHRYTISFGEMTEEEARRWPDLMAIVEQRVKPHRMTDNREVRRRYWWRFGEVAPALYDSVAGCEIVLAINCGATPHMSFSFINSRMVFANTLDVFPLQSFSSFCALQSRPHELWARFFSSSMKDDLRYAPSDCFETFPFPKGFETDPRLEEAGRAYYEFRAALMVRNNEGLTKTYNRFHDPDERSPDILRLRELHAAMDNAVLEAYGWHDLAKSATCEFLLDYEDDEEDDEESNGRRRRKKPWHYRWPDDFRDEVLARLLELNRQRAEEERLRGGGSENSGKKSKGKTTRGKKKSTNDDQLNMFSLSSSKTGVS
jgi:hypothetical protein